MTQQLQEWMIYRFIARPDAFAVQREAGNWMPVRDNDNNLVPWNRQSLQDHLDGTKTHGHYMVRPDDNIVNLITFDIDWINPKSSEDKAQGFLPASYDQHGVVQEYEVADTRAAWLDRANPHRNWMKAQMRMISHKIASITHQQLEIPVAVAYTGNKGLHVYAFTGAIAAGDARIAANLVMEALETFKLVRGSFEWRDCEPDIDKTLSNFTVEVFPKQDEVSGDGFGNLVALPLGVNRKNPGDPKFFLDLRAPMNELVPRDALWSLATENPWSDS